MKLQSAYFEQLIDGLVYELYFPDEIKAAGALYDNSGSARNSSRKE